MTAWRQSTLTCQQIIEQFSIVAVVATGGFVAAPAVETASRAGLPIALVNLDAVPGRANRLLARKATELFSVYPVSAWPQARPIGLPLSAASIGPDDPADARRQLRLDGGRQTLLVTGGSQGAESINRMMVELLQLSHAKAALGTWQVLHLTGPAAADTAVFDHLKKAYREAGIDARIETFCNNMGLAWRAASMAIARAGAGTVAEAWANATPTIFLPYPYHRDQHQRRNAAPLVDAGAAVVLADLIDPAANARQIVGPLTGLINNQAQRRHMVTRLRDTQPENGAQTVALWIAKHLKNPSPPRA